MVFQFQLAETDSEITSKSFQPQTIHLMWILQEFFYDSLRAHDSFSLIVHFEARSLQNWTLWLLGNEAFVADHLPHATEYFKILKMELKKVKGNACYLLNKMYLLANFWTLILWFFSNFVPIKFNWFQWHCIGLCQCNCLQIPKHVCKDILSCLL